MSWSRVSFAFVLAVSTVASGAEPPAAAIAWITNPDRSALFARQAEGLEWGPATPGGRAIDVDESRRFQTIDGFGFALTQGSALHLVRMSPRARAALLAELFGISYLRVSIGASDLNERVFSYDDPPAGETDPDLRRFDLGPDRADVLPVLKEILGLNPDIKILASPWSAPRWMKTNNDVKGGMLEPKLYDTYARYLVRYVQAMAKEGVRIDALTIQNEPLHPGNTPSMVMEAVDQADFIKRHLGPALVEAKLDTKIVIYDHNCDKPEYPLTILKDPEAAKYVDGSGFHLYGGEVSAMGLVHDAHPDKHVYFTEQMLTEPPGSAAIHIGPAVRRLVIGTTRNWSRNVILWNLAADPANQPHTDNGGCGICQGAITIDGDTVTRNIAYYAIAHVSKHVRPGSTRIESTWLEGFPSVAFRTPEGRIVAVVANDHWSPGRVKVRHNGRQFMLRLNPGAVGTFVW
jgi:glucosylceramidase